MFVHQCTKLERKSCNLPQDNLVGSSRVLDHLGVQSSTPAQTSSLSSDRPSSATTSSSTRAPPRARPSSAAVRAPVRRGTREATITNSRAVRFTRPLLESNRAGRQGLSHQQHLPPEGNNTVYTSGIIIPTPLEELERREAERVRQEGKKYTHTLLVY